MNDIGTALDNLVMATTNDQNLMEQLINSNATLTKNNEQLSQQLQAAMQTIEILQNDTAQKEVKQLARIKKYKAKLDPHGYCHTHGFEVVKGHNSATCTNKGPNHMDTAT